MGRAAVGTGGGGNRRWWEPAAVGTGGGGNRRRWEPAAVGTGAMIEFIAPVPTAAGSHRDAPTQLPRPHAGADRRRGETKTVIRKLPTKSNASCAPPLVQNRGLAAHASGCPCGFTLPLHIAHACAGWLPLPTASKTAQDHMQARLRGVQWARAHVLLFRIANPKVCALRWRPCAWPSSLETMRRRQTGSLGGLRGVSVQSIPDLVTPAQGPGGP